MKIKNKKIVLFVSTLLSLVGNSFILADPTTDDEDDANFNTWYRTQNPPKIEPITNWWNHAHSGTKPCTCVEYGGPRPENETFWINVSDNCADLGKALTRAGVTVSCQAGD